MRGVAGVGDAGQTEGILEAEQQRVVVIRRVVRDRALALVGYHDRGNVAAAWVGATATGPGLTLVREVVLVPGDDDGVAALPPLLRRHDLAHGVADGNETVGGRAGTRAVHVMTLVGDDQAEVGQIAG